jgi:hypothetical protein
MRCWLDSSFKARVWYNLARGNNMQEPTHVKEEARKLVEELPDNVSWADFARLVLERRRIEEGLADLDAGVTWTSDEIREKLGIPQCE